MAVINITEKSEFENTVSSNDLVVVHFYADWAAQCGPMNEVLEELVKQEEFENVKFAKCPAEDLPEVSLKYDVSSVPTFLLLRNGKLVDRVDGANAAELTKKISVQISKIPIVIPPKPPKEDLNTRLHKLINADPVMLFMKGTAVQPRCGFSKSMIALLDSLEAQYKTFDILNDEEIRQGLKTYSNWPTYPQLYINGELIGGLDIVKEMHANGELEALLPKKQSLEARLKSLTHQSECMVFMKGNRNEPRCGFSRQLMAILAETGIKFDTFDILTDEEVRQGLKTFSNWPTYPQVYVKGELIGGLDIIKELKESGELLNTLKGQS
ncbi:glutaredoxin-3 [Periplaneta americana]|uniref:glutaredoxin-3 n=1 Tax=Periplaneta americana TaxID=6978 RepID=UPI0037E78582